VGIRVTDEAAELLSRSLVMGGVDAANGGVRLRAAKALGGGVDVQVELADSPLPGETTIEAEGVRIFVDPDVTATIPDAVVAVEPQHDRIVVRPAATGDDA
jgi:Fe-S cluster assembly iron-binding protein IscA